MTTPLDRSCRYVKIDTTAVETLIRDASIEHGPIRVVFTCLEQMETSVKHLIELAKLWGAQR